MASLDARKGQSPRPKGRENAKNTLCRNLTLYGSCRTQNSGCPYSHDFNRIEAPNDPAKRFLNVDSPSFTPLAPATNTHSTKATGISPKAAAAAVFTPRAAGGTATPVNRPTTSQGLNNDWSGEFREFVPQRFNEFEPEPAAFDPYSMQGVNNALPDGTSSQINPYAQDTSASMYQTAATYTHNHPLNYHLYAPIGPHRDGLTGYQRTVHDLFIPDHLREELQRKTEATLQTFSNSTLPQQIEHFHSLVALDTTAQKAASVYGYPSWLYKAVSAKDGYTYCLRRLENFRLTDERAIRAIGKWKKVVNSNIVLYHDAFTTRAFGDSSLIIVTDYHPLSQTLADKYLTQTMNRHPMSRNSQASISEQELWSFIIQIAFALKAIHSAGLAARVVHPQKILMTSKNRIRLNSCGVLDVTHFEQQRPLGELQEDDLVQLGRLVISLTTKSHVSAHGASRGLDQVLKTYGETMRNLVAWLITSPANPVGAELAGDRNIDVLLSMLSPQMAVTFDAALNDADTVTGNLARELENARLVRLLAKINCILERPDQMLSNNQPPQGPAALNNTNNTWSETGERYYLKLFRDYVFHQVDADGRPVLDLGRILACLNKLDAGIDEKILLISRDEQNCFLVTFRELKRSFDGAWTDLVKASNAVRR